MITMIFSDEEMRFLRTAIRDYTNKKHKDTSTTDEQFSKIVDLRKKICSSAKDAPLPERLRGK